jgi:hypothetical protein
MFQKLYEEGCREFTLESLKEKLEKNIIKEFNFLFTDPATKNSESQRRLNFKNFCFWLIDGSMITKSGIINIWMAIAEHASGSSYATVLLTGFIAETKKYVKKIDEKSQEVLVKKVRDIIKSQVKNPELGKFRKEMEQILQNFETLIKTCSSTSKVESKQETEEPTENPAKKKKSKRRKPQSKNTNETPEESTKQSPLNEFEKMLKANERIDDEKLKEILSNFDSTEKEIRNVTKIFFDSVKHREDIGKLALNISTEFDSVQEPTDDITFKKVLLSMLQNSFKKLPKFDHLSTEEDVDLAEFLVQLTGELYNIGWIDQPKLISCMDKLALSSFGSNHQLKMFHSLLRIIENEMVRQKQLGKCKYYLELLNTTDKNKKLKFLKCVEILQRILKTTKEEEESDDEVDNEFDELLNKMSDETLNEVAQNLALMFSTDAAENVLIMLAKFTSKALENPKLYAKLVKATNSTTFESLVLDQCQEDFLNSTSSDKIEPKVIDLVEFIGELYNEDLASDDLTKICMDVLFGVKSTCDVTVDSISMLIRTVRARMENIGKDKLDHYFKYFSYVVDLKEDSYRSMMFEFLIILRNNEWKCDENAAKPLVDHHLNQLCETEVPSISLKLQRLMKDSEAIAIVVIRKIWEVVILKPELISLCTKLTNEMSNAELMQDNETKLKFAELLIQFLTQRHAAFSSISSDQFNDKIKSRLGQVITFVAELYQLEIVPDDFMEFWLAKYFVENLIDVHAAQISTTISRLVNNSENLQLKLKLIKLDDKINDDLSKFKESITIELETLSLSLKKK